MDMPTELHLWEVRALLIGASLIVRPLEEQPDKDICCVTPIAGRNERDFVQWKGACEQDYNSPVWRLYRPGDCLVGLEEWYPCKNTTFNGQSVEVYKATWMPPKRFPDFEPRWRPASEMPPALSRIRRTIAGVEVKRIREMTEKEAKMMGIKPYEFDKLFDESGIRLPAEWKLYVEEHYPAAWEQNHWAAFVRLEVE